MGIRSKMERKLDNSKDLVFEAAPVQREKEPHQAIVDYAKTLEAWQEKSLRSRKRLGCAHNPYE